MSYDREPIRNLDSSVGMALDGAKERLTATESFVWDTADDEGVVLRERAQVADWLERIAEHVRRGNLVSFAGLTWKPGDHVFGNLVPVQPINYVAVNVKLAPDEDTDAP